MPAAVKEAGVGVQRVEGACSLPPRHLEVK